MIDGTRHYFVSFLLFYFTFLFYFIYLFTFWVIDELRLCVSVEVSDRKEGRKEHICACVILSA